MEVSDSRRYPPRPVLGVGGIILDGSKVLLVERGKPPLVGYWSIPGGVVETGERLEDALVREVWEETGLKVTADFIATVFERIMPDETGGCEYHYVLIDFYCTIEGGELRPGDDAHAAQWFEIHKLNGLAMTAGTREVIVACYDRGAPKINVMRP